MMGSFALGSPEMLRSSLPAAAFEGMGHQGSNGSGCGTLPPHGCSSESTAFLGCGMVMAECASPVGSMAAVPSSSSSGPSPPSRPQQQQRFIILNLPYRTVAPLY